MLLSLFAIARPVAADHSGFDHQPLPINTSTFEEDPAECEGVDLEPGEVLLHWIASQQNVTEAITLTLFLEGGGELTADSYKWNEPANVDSNVTHHFEFIVDGDILVEDLEISTGEGNVRLSHVCRAEEGQDLVLIKQDLEETTLDGVGFTLGDGDEMLTVGGQITFEDLAEGSHTLTETSNPDENCETGGTLTVTVSAEGDITVTDDDETDGLAIVSFDAETNTLVLSNDCEENGEEGQDLVLIKQDLEETTLDGVGFTLGDGDEMLTVGGQITFEDLAEGSHTLTETSNPDENCETGGTLTVTVSAEGDITVTDDDETDGLAIVSFDAETNTLVLSNDCEENGEEGGLVEIDKLFCFTDDEEGSTEFFVLGPIEFPTETYAIGQVEGELPDEGCWTEAVTFTITGGDLTEPREVMTDEDGILEIELPASENAYVITEDISGESAEFFVEEGEFTAILVLNLVPEEEDAGLVKVIKLFCEGDVATVEFIVEGGDAPVPAISGCELGDATFELGDVTITTEDGIALEIVAVGEYTFAETDPNQATYDGTVVVEAGEITTIIVIDTFEEGEQPGGGGPGGGEQPGQETPREGTQGGNPVPNTALSPTPTGSLPAALVALVMLAGLGAAGYAVRTEVARRR